MLAITHLVVCLLLIQLLTLDRNDAFVALLFGFFIDIDHVLGLKSYVQTNGCAAVFNFGALCQADGHWKSLFHSPVAFAIISPLAMASRMAVPLIFWGAHIFMDYVEDAYLGVFSGVEASFLVIVTATLIAMRYRAYLESFSSGTFTHYMHLEFSRVSRLVGPAAFRTTY